MPLIAVACDGHEAVVRPLLNHIPNVNQRDSYPSADIYVMARDRDYPFKNPSKQFKKEKRVEVRNALWSLIEATAADHVGVVKAMLDDETYRRQWETCTDAHQGAIALGHQDAVDILLDYGVVTNQVTSNSEPESSDDEEFDLDSRRPRDQQREAARR